jgi:hypothetical protein
MFSHSLKHAAPVRTVGRPAVRTRNTSRCLGWQRPVL